MLDPEVLRPLFLQRLHLRAAIKVRMPAADKFGKHSRPQNVDDRDLLLPPDRAVSGEELCPDLWTPK